MRELAVKFRVDSAEAAAGFRRIQAEAQTTGNRIKSAFSGIAASIRGAFSGLPGLLTGITAGLSVANLVSVNREFARLGAQPEKQPDGRYIVHVIDSIIAQHTVMHGASVTYTPESWRHLNDTLWERYPDESAVMVGWYHTHPGFGIFLSGMDLFIHQNFFTQIWHVAYVLDPRARNSGFFCWNRQKTKVNRYDFQWPDWAAGSW